MYEGFDSMGRPVPKERMAAAYDTAKEIGFETEDAMTLVGRMADCIERDDPYGAMRVATDAPIAKPVSSVRASFRVEPGPRVDMTGAYRLMAVLCSAPVEAVA